MSEASSIAPPDAAAREAAVTTFDRNLVVIAGAGSGKTGLLVERLLCQLVLEELPLARVAAITFTEKAAAEMRTRLEGDLERLLDLAASETPRLDLHQAADRCWGILRRGLASAEIARRAGRALREVPRATVTTIHGFCAALLRAHPLEADLAPDFTPLEEERLAGLRDELWRAFLEGESGPEAAPADWQRALADFDPGELRDLAFGLASFTIPELPATPRLPDLHTTLAPALEARLDEIDRALATQPDPSRGPGSYLRVARKAVVALRDGGAAAFRAVLAQARFVDGRGRERALLEGSAPHSSEEPEASHWAERVRARLAELERVDDAALEPALALALPLATRIREEALRRGRVPFDALLVRARELLASHPTLRRALGRRFRLLLVDEFQDTDPLQYEIVFWLAQSMTRPPAHEALTTALEPGKLFIVGDPKQAIYRFRGADIAAYTRAVAQVEASGGRRLELTTTWRSPEALVEPLNRLFAPLLGADADGADADLQPGFAEMRTGRPAARDGPRIELWSLLPERASAEEARRAEGEAIAAWVERELGADRLRLGDVAILLRSRGPVGLYTRPFHERGLPVVVEGGAGLAERPEVRSLRALLRALADPDDAVALLGVLRSPLAAAEDRELARWAQQGDGGWAWRRAQPDPVAFPSLERAFAFLRRWQERAALDPIDRLLCRLLEETPLLAANSAALDGAQRLANLRRAAERIAERGRAEPQRGLAEIVAAFESEDAAERRASPPGLTEGRDVVRILSVHGAKGLEFPVVILPDLARGREGADARRRPRAEAHWLRDQGAPAIHTERADSTAWLLRRWSETRHEEAERRRLFYVAATRACERLILVHATHPRAGPGGWVEHLAPWGYDPGAPPAEGPLVGEPRVLHRRIEGPASAGVPRSRAPKREVREAVRRTQAVAERARAAAEPAFRTPSGAREELDSHTETDGTARTLPRGVAEREARASGVAVHELLERCDFAEPARVRAWLEPAATRAARALGVDTSSILEETRAILEGFLASRLPTELAAREILGREIPLLLRDDEGRRWTGTIDLLYRDADGRLVVADYKTDREPSPESIGRYRDQLRVYAAAARRAYREGPEPALELVWVRTGERLRL